MSCARGVAVFTPYCVMQVTEESVPAGRPDRGMGPPNRAPASCSEESASDAALAAPSSAAPLGSASLSNTSTSRSACAAVADRQAALYWRVGWLSVAAVNCCSKQAVRVLGFHLLLFPTHTEQARAFMMQGSACMLLHVAPAMRTVLQVVHPHAILCALQCAVALSRATVNIHMHRLHSTGRHSASAATMCTYLLAATSLLRGCVQAVCVNICKHACRRCTTS
jgi:hypothetical protein